MDLRELEPAGLKRIREQDVSPRDIRWLAQVDVERAALEERWGAPETVCDDFAEWFCFAFSPAEGEAFILLRQVDRAPVAGFVLSVTKGLFSPEAAERIVEALETAGARVTQVNAEEAPLHPERPASFRSRETRPSCPSSSTT
ncbi:hypothetical protein [Streptomyces triticisoli]|jgi:hypothetical protein|uniref:hypothetical protein n=1 Tax=Streptomyces triticisoli TaxID=2182797 RepID=UPI001E4A35D8|nr:hypothetical protein [Streptomyces triticisoli]